jgi:zinc protease
MKKITVSFLMLLITSTSFAKSSFLDSVERMKWGDTEVVWVEDDKFPQFTASVYFKDGGLSDKFSGITQATFDQLISGTPEQSQREIAEFFDFYGANIRNAITHEYSVLTIAALVKDIEPVMGKVCELFNKASYPKDELTSYISRAKSNLRNLVTSHGGLADRVFRQVSLANTPFAEPVEGTLESLDKLKPEILAERLKKLNKTKKILYLAGPSGVKDIKDVLKNKCNWTNETELKPISLKKPGTQSALYLVPVSGANQAQIRIGRYMTAPELEGKHDKFEFLSSFLGGGFTSKLVQELRVKRGLTYSAGAYISAQRDYARAGIMTFSKNETTAEAIALIRDIFQEVSNPSKINEKEFKHQQGHQIGGYAFGFEQTAAFLSRIMLYDHQHRKLEELEAFPDKIALMTPSELAQASLEAFPWDRMTIVVVGDKNLVKSLSRIRPVRILDYKKFL